MIATALLLAGSQPSTTSSSQVQHYQQQPAKHYQQQPAKHYQLQPAKHLMGKRKRKVQRVRDAGGSQGQEEHGRDHTVRIVATHPCQPVAVTAVGSSLRVVDYR